MAKEVTVKELLDLFKMHAVNSEKEMKEQREQLAEHQKILGSMLEIMNNGGQPKFEAKEPETLSSSTIHSDREAEMVAKLAGRIPKFEYVPDELRTFPKWYDRYGEVITIDGQRLSDNTKLRLLIERLDEASYERYASEVLPKTPTEGSFEEAVNKLKTLFDVKTSVVTERYKCLKLRKHESEDIGQFTARVNEQCERAKLSELTTEELKALFWLFGLDSPVEGDIRPRLLAVMEKRHEERYQNENTSALTMQDLRTEYEKIRSFWKDSALIEQKPVRINAVAETESRSEKQRQARTFECYNCGVTGHYSYECTKAKVSCGRCGRHHLEKYCGKHRRSTARSGRSEVNYVGLNSVTIDVAHVDRLRSYVDVHIGGKAVSLKLDTGSDITLLSVDDWKRIGSPDLKDCTSVVARTASGYSVKLNGVVRCTYRTMPFTNLRKTVFNS